MRRQLNRIAILVSILIILVLSLKCFLKSMILAVMGDDSIEWKTAEPISKFNLIK